MSEERESEERVAQGLGELPEDLEESRWPEGPGPERDEISRWTNNAAAVPAADLLAARASGARGMAAPAPEISQPVFQLLPEGSHPWTFSSDEKPRQPFYQDLAWTFEIANTSGYEAVLTELDWSLLPMSDVVQYMDIRLTAFLMGAPALGMRLLPVGQSAKLQTQLRIPTAGKLSLRVSALALPVLQPPSSWAPISFVVPRQYVRVGEKTYCWARQTTNGAWVQLMATGNWGKSWEIPLPNIVLSGITLQGALPLLTAYDGNLVTFGEIGAVAGIYAIWASPNGGITWEPWILDTSVIDADFVGTPVGAVVVDGTLCIVFWNLAGYTTFRTQRGHPENTWSKTIGNVLPAPPAVGMRDIVEYAGKMVTTYGMTSATGVVATEKLVLAWSGDLGKTWVLVNTPMPFYSDFNVMVHGDQLWFLNGLDAAGGWPAETWWTDDLLNFHKAADVPWSVRADCAVVASNDRILCFAGGTATSQLDESRSGGMVHSLADLVLHPMLRASGFYLPPRT